MKKTVCFIGAHPDDLIGSAGLAIRMAESGEYDLHVIDLTRGERGLAGPGVTLTSTAAIRSAEEAEACSRIGAAVHFLEEIDGTAFAGEEVCRRLASLLKELNPVLMTTHWPVDVHLDHVMCYAAVRKAMALAGIAPELYFFEESAQARSMPVQYYVPLQESHLRKKAELIRCYACQNEGDCLTARKLAEARYHGWRSGNAYAEPYAAMEPPAPSRNPVLSAFLQD